MVKTTIYLQNDLALTIRQLAAAKGRAQADLIREALATYVSQQTGRPTSRGFGKYSSGRTDISEHAEDILMDAAKRGGWR